ncbi:MAG: NUDIX domain-containing protein [Bacilli bacterium]|nr:NUDIX domain-containing protein [Bacilli bacterium]
MEPDRFLLRCAVHLFLIKDGKILVEKRKNREYGNHQYDVIASHILGNENVYDAMIRTAKQEVNIDIRKEDLKIVQVMHQKSESYEYINYFFVANTYSGTLQNMDDAYCEGIEWLPFQYPIPHMMPYLNEAIHNYLEHPLDPFTFFGW